MAVTTPVGIFVLGELTGPVADRIAEVVRKHDPRLARLRPAHLTIAGSSGLGPIAADTGAETLRAALEPITSTTPPIWLRLGAPHRFPQTQIVVLPLDPHGPLRVLHDRIGSSGLHFGRPRFTFSPHVTLSLYRTLSPECLRELMAVRVSEPVLLDRIRVYFTNDPQPARMLLELPLTGPDPALPGRPPER